MPSSRTYHPILPSLNIASVAMPSLATASRIPAPQRASVAMPSLATASRIPAPQRATVARVPSATAGSNPRPVNTPSVARKYTPTVQRARPSTTVASMASAFAAMSISNPVNLAIAPPSAPKPTSSLPCAAVPCSKLVCERIQARRQRVIANLQPPKKRPTSPASIPPSSSMPSRAVSPSAVAPVSILKSVSRPSRVIPPPPPDAPASILVCSWMPQPRSKPRGTEPYCHCRPCSLDKHGNRFRGDYEPLSYFGRKGDCHEGDIKPYYESSPRSWKTTPAEEDVDPARPRVVRFAAKLVSSTRTFRPWYNKVWPVVEKSQDDTTEAEDDAAIRAMDSPPAPDAITNPPPPNSDFNSIWQALMDEGFPDDDD